MAHLLPRRQWLCGLVGAIVCTWPMFAADAAGSALVEWKSVTIADGDSRDRVARMVRSLLRKATKRANFGSAKRVTCVARMTELSWQRRGDVLRLSCTLLGRIEGGPSARSRISFGGRPSERSQLEHQVLTMVTQGVVARLAQIARARSAAPDRSPT